MTVLTVASLVPHAGDMSLLDHIISVDDTHLVAEVTPKTDDLFYREDSVGSWVGIEYMAQAIAAWAGWQGKKNHRPPRIGFLLGTRQYVAHVPVFVTDTTLTVHVEAQFIADNGLGQFACRIEQDGQCLATAQLKVFEPSDTHQFIKDSAQ